MNAWTNLAKKLSNELYAHTFSPAALVCNVRERSKNLCLVIVVEDQFPLRSHVSDTTGIGQFELHRTILGGTFEV